MYAFCSSCFWGGAAHRGNGGGRRHSARRAVPPGVDAPFISHRATPVPQKHSSSERDPHFVHAPGGPPCFLLPVRVSRADAPSLVPSSPRALRGGRVWPLNGGRGGGRRRPPTSICLVGRLFVAARLSCGVAGRRRRALGMRLGYAAALSWAGRPDLIAALRDSCADGPPDLVAYVGYRAWVAWGSRPPGRAGQGAPAFRARRCPSWNRAVPVVLPCGPAWDAVCSVRPTQPPYMLVLLPLALLTMAVALCRVLPAWPRPARRPRIAGQPSLDYRMTFTPGARPTTIALSPTEPLVHPATDRDVELDNLSRTMATAARSPP